ncbi:MAG: hypothetical protein J2P21_16555 [Chloracidobacterium sp.]|nr:hypothetical protein [Chloracidobacterium sp.]
MVEFCIWLFILIFTLITTISGTAQKGPAEFLARVDHLVYAMPDLNRGVEEIKKFLGVQATPGGTPRRASDRCLLFALGLDLPVQSGPRPALVVNIDSPRGIMELR